MSEAPLITELHKISKDGELAQHGCIEDRIPIEKNNQPIDENIEFKQVPGCDIFFVLVGDIVDEMDSPGIVQEEGRTISKTVLDGVKTANELGIEFLVHDDAGHGEEYDGCGFAKFISKIYEYTGQNSHELAKQHDAKSNTKLDSTMIEDFGTAILRIAENETYWDTTGGELVKLAVENGAVLLTYKDEHTGNTLRIDGENDSTYDSRTANDPDNELPTSFNVDVDLDLQTKLEAYGVKAEKSKTELITKLVSIGTVRVLGAEGDIEHC